MFSFVKETAELGLLDDEIEDQSKESINCKYFRIEITFIFCSVGLHLLLETESECIGGETLTDIRLICYWAVLQITGQSYVP